MQPRSRPCFTDTAKSLPLLCSRRGGKIRRIPRPTRLFHPRSRSRHPSRLPPHFLLSPISSRFRLLFPHRRLHRHPALLNRVGPTFSLSPTSTAPLFPSLHHPSRHTILLPSASVLCNHLPKPNLLCKCVRPSRKESAAKVGGESRRRDAETALVW